MRLSMAIAALGLAAAGPAAAEEPAACLQLSRLESLSYVDRTTILAEMRPQARFVIKLSGRCGYDKLDQTLVFWRDHLGRCLEANDVLFTRDGAPCFVESVAPAPAR